mgnify:CR=1 FL=1
MKRPALLRGLQPVVGQKPRLLLLGSFPSVASLAAQQYYAHPRNHFWPVVSALLQQPLASWPYAQRVAGVQDAGLAIWDVYVACRREGSLDAAIEEAKLNDLAGFVAAHPTLKLIAHNGGESARAMRVTQALGLPVRRLPSTSPANASWSFERKLAPWRSVFQEAEII